MFKILNLNFLLKFYTFLFGGKYIIFSISMKAVLPFILIDSGNDVNE